MKPLNDWTLQELKEHCAKFGDDCEDCLFYDGTLFCQFENAPMKWDLTPPTKEVTLTWHKFPEDPPSVTGEYLTLSKSVVGKGARECRIGFFNKEKNSFPWFSGVYAWAEFPERFDWSDAE